MADYKATTLYGKQGTEKFPIFPKTAAELVAMPDASGAASTVKAEVEALRTKVETILAVGVRLKGVVNATADLPTTDYEAGDEYVVKTAGTYAGQTCEPGDVILCVTTYAADTAADSDWVVIQANIVNADNLSDGTTNVMMRATERTKLEGVAEGAEVNQNAVSNVKVGTTTVAATDKTDTVELAAGDGITLTADADAKKVTVAETYVDTCIVESLDATPSNLRDGGLIILKEADSSSSSTETATE